MVIYWEPREAIQVFLPHFGAIFPMSVAPICYIDQDFKKCFKIAQEANELLCETGTTINIVKFYFINW